MTARMESSFLAGDVCKLRFVSLKELNWGKHGKAFK